MCVARCPPPFRVLFRLARRGQRLPASKGPTGRTSTVSQFEILNSEISLLTSVHPVAALQQRFPSAGILVEEMVPYRGVEIIIGALYDPTFGPAVMVGAGGILTELYKDVAFRLAPCTAKEARHMLEELTIYPTLRGYRGLSGDADSLAQIVSKVAELALQLIREGCQLDINPIVWSRDRWVALDVKAIVNGN